VISGSFNMVHALCCLAWRLSIQLGQKAKGLIAAAQFVL
jgi:hypothetical protein